jgi:hypothetical protein
MQAPANKLELLNAVRSAFTELEAVVAHIPENQLSVSGAGDDWTLKDTVAHIAFWQSSLVDRIEAALHHRPVDPPPDISPAEVDRLNRQAVEASRARSWAEVHADLRRSLQSLLHLVESLPEEELFAPHRFQEIERAPLWRAIAGETYAHYQEHIDTLRSWQGKE